MKGGYTVNIGAALDYVKNTVFTPSSGSRAQQGVPQILVLLTGMKSQDNVLDPIDALKNAGVVVFGVGLNNADRFEMEKIAPRAEYFVKKISDFPIVREQLLSDIISIKDTISPDVGECNFYNHIRELQTNIFKET